MTMKYSLSLCGIVLLASCNLAIDTNDHPYQQSIVIADASSDDAVPDQGTPLPDMAGDTTPDLAPDMEIDMGPVGVPELMITEVLINTSLLVGNGEVGEFIEIKNVGSGPADPRQVTFQVVSDGGAPQTISVPTPTNAEQLAIHKALKPILPGEYFVYVRFVSDDFPLTSLTPVPPHFDYGEGGVLVSLGNSGSRTLTMQYFDGQTSETQDSIRWSSNALRPIADGELTPSLAVIEDVSFSVGRDFENRTDNDLPDKWCEEITEVAGPGTVFASPGGPSICNP